MESYKEHFRHIMLYKFNEGKNATEAANDIKAVYKNEAPCESTCRYWFARFKNGNFDLNDEPREGRPKTMDNAQLEALLEENPAQTEQELAFQLGVSQMTISRHLHDLGKVLKAGKWVPHMLTEDNKYHRLTICNSLALRMKKKSFLYRIVTGDETWIYYENPVLKKQWLNPGQTPHATPKPDLHRKKVMLCIWWDSQGVLYYELLPEGQTVNADRYSTQLIRLSEEIARKRPSTGRQIILLHDNARPHVAKMTRQTIEELRWEAMPHPAYSPDLAPSDYHLFRDLKSHLSSQSFSKAEEIKNWLLEYFASKNQLFFERGIHDLPLRWGKVIASDGDYFD